MMNRSLIRRLERLETRLQVNRITRIRVEICDTAPDGTLIPRPDPNNDRMEPQRTIRVRFVKPVAWEPAPKNEGQTP
jgi:hypothetical protein